MLKFDSEVEREKSFYFICGHCNAQSSAGQARVYCPRCGTRALAGERDRRIEALGFLSSTEGRQMLLVQLLHDKTRHLRR